MPKDSRRSGLTLVLAGLLGAGFFVMTDPKLGMTGRAAGMDVVDAIRQASPGTWIGIVGGIVIAGIGIWLTFRTTA